MVEVDGIAKSYGDVAALRGVSFVARAGEIVGLLGPNGAGKTTLVRILATLLRPDSGTARVGGFDLAYDAAAARRLIGLAGQAAAVDELLTGRENLELIGALYGVDRPVCRGRAAALLDRLGLADAADRRVGTYSGGMRRRLDLGATLIGEPAVILLDEPTAGLDPRSRHELWASVRQIASDGTTILLTSQYLEEVERLADRIVVLDRGELIADAPPDALQRAICDQRIEAAVVEDADVPRAAAVLAGVGAGEPHVDADARRVSVATTAGVATLVAAARHIDDAGIALTELSVRQPSLDEVFLALTGDDDRVEPIVVARDAAPDPRRRPDAAPRRHAWRDARTITGLYLRRFRRVPQLFIFTAAQPVAFVLGLQAVFGGLVEGATGSSYVQYLLPGVVVMQVLFAGSVTSVGMADDMQAGIMDRFRSLPMSRAAVLAGRTAADLVRNAVAVFIAIVTGIALGFRFHGTVVETVAFVALLLAFSYATAWLFAAVGLAVRNPAAAQLAGFLPALPLVYLSGAWVPVESIDPSIQTFARNQPVNVMVATARGLAAGEPVGSSGWQAVAWIAVILVVTVPFATRLFRGDGH